MRVRLWKSQTFAVGIIFAVAGFCHAVSTLPAPTRQPGASGRAVGTATLRITNPLVAAAGFANPGNEYDLGDACFGSIITRYLTAEGGLKPYRWTSEGTNSLVNLVTGTANSLQLGISGVLAGSAPFAVVTKTVTGAPGIRFFAQVSDAAGTTQVKTGFFNLFLVNCNIFRFATPSQLPDALLDASYIYKVEVIGGVPPYTFSAVSVSGAAASPQKLGLFVASDGTIMGRPLVTGTATIRIHCVDSKGQIAQSRAQTGFDQDFTVNISPNTVTSSDVMTQTCSVKGDNPSSGKDTLTYKAYINAVGQDNFNLLNSDFNFRFSGIGFSGRLDKNGEFHASQRDGSKVSAKVNIHNGTVMVSIKNGTFDKALNAAALVSGTVREGVQVSVGQAVNSAEVLDCVSRVSGSKYTLNFALGKMGTNAGGGFELISVKGKDAPTTGGQDGDSWLASFIAAPRLGITDPAGAAGLTGVTSLTVRIGTNFVQKLSGALLSSSSGKINFKGDAFNGVRKLSLDPKSFKGKLQTNVINTIFSGIPQANNSSSLSNIYFPLGIDIARTGAPFTGEHARRIFGLKNQYVDVPPTRTGGPSTRLH